MQLTVTFDARELTQGLERLFGQEVRTATMVAITRTAWDIKGTMQAQMPSIFNAPTPYTLRNSIFVKGATRSNLTATVGVTDNVFKGTPAIRFLGPEIYGGKRGHKGFEARLQAGGKMPPGMYAVPATRLPKDAYGNVSRGLLQKILSDVGAQRDVLQRSTATSKGKRKRSRTKFARYYFSTWPTNARTAHLKPGIYERVLYGDKSTLQPAMIFTSAPHYRPRFKFFDIASDRAKYALPFNFNVAMRQAIVRSRLRAT